MSTIRCKTTLKTQCLCGRGPGPACLCLCPDRGPLCYKPINSLRSQTALTCGSMKVTGVMNRKSLRRRRSLLLSLVTPVFYLHAASHVNYYWPSKNVFCLVITLLHVMYNCVTCQQIFVCLVKGKLKLKLKQKTDCSVFFLKKNKTFSCFFPHGVVQ